MMSMTYFMDPSPLAYALLFAGLAIAVSAIAVTARSATYRIGSPAAVADRTAFRAAAIAGAVLMIAGAAPLLAGPVRALLAGTGL